MNHVCPLTLARTLSTQTSACYQKGLNKLFVDCWKYECQNVLLFSEDLFSILCEDNILNTLQEPDQSVFRVGLRRLAQKAEWVWWSVPITSSSLTQATQWPPKPRHAHCLSTHTHTHPLTLFPDLSGDVELPLPSSFFPTFSLSPFWDSAGNLL